MTKWMPFPAMIYASVAILALAGLFLIAARRAATLTEEKAAVQESNAAVQKRLTAVQERLVAAEAGLASCQEDLVAQGIAARAATLPQVGAKRTEVFCINDTTLRLTHEYWGAKDGWSERLEKVDDAPHDLTAGCWQIRMTP